MANGSGANAFLAFVVGGLLVFVVLVFVFGWSGDGGETVKVELPNPTDPIKQTR